MKRPLGQMIVHQRTKDSMFNATLFLKQWNKLSGMKKSIKDYLSNKSTKDLIEEIIAEQSMNGVITPIKASRANKGINAGTWMHPYLFLDFAMWINPKFKLQVIKFVYDQLIEFRHDAGDNYISLSSSVSSLKGTPDYRRVAIGIQYIVFNKKGKDLRQTANSEQLKEIAEIERNLAFAIDMQYIQTFKQLMNELIYMYNRKYKRHG